MSISKYFTIHCLYATEIKEFSIVVANVINEPGKLETALRLYPAPGFYIEYHEDKKEFKWVFK